MDQARLQALAEQLASLDQRELVYVIARSLPTFEPYRSDPQVDRSGFFLGAFAVQQGGTTIDVVAYPDPAEYGHDLGPDWGLVQRAPSEVGGLDYVSNFKQCLSPLNGGKVDLS